MVAGLVFPQESELVQTFSDLLTKLKTGDKTWPLQHQEGDLCKNDAHGCSFVSPFSTTEGLAHQSNGRDITR